MEGIISPMTKKFDEYIATRRLKASPTLGKFLPLTWLFEKNIINLNPNFPVDSEVICDNAMWSLSLSESNNSLSTGFTPHYASLSMKTNHKILFQDARELKEIASESVDLVVTSPPYPMINMWDDMFSNQNVEIERALAGGDGRQAYELMHQILDSVWDELFRVLKNDRFACINIGDATRKIKDDFCLYPNHARILNYLLSIGFSVLPDILWRKQTNAPNKFMGSGMLPAGAYVTLEHEYVLISEGKAPRENLRQRLRKETDVKVRCFGRSGIFGIRIFGRMLKEQNRAFLMGPRDCGVQHFLSIWPID